MVLVMAEPPPKCGLPPPVRNASAFRALFLERKRLRLGGIAAKIARKNQRLSGHGGKAAYHLKFHFSFTCGNP
jgi:hypothetical protein